MQKFLKITLVVSAFLIIPSIVSAADLLEKKDFFVDPSYDAAGRTKITAVLQRITDNLYFYLDDNWWGNLDIDKRREVNVAIDTLAQEFTNKIYPVLTSNFGTEWRPGINGDNRITVLVHPMIELASGYFNPGDEYPRAQVAKSNEREMIYLSSNQITGVLNKSFFAHELMHLITFYQKDKLQAVSEETWLNEARAEYAPALLGYNNVYQNSYLQRRVKSFAENPQNSLTEWQGKTNDYGVTNLFTQYLVDHYGLNILIDSLKSAKTGIPSLNEALKKNGFVEDFSQIFTDWTIAIFVNNCKISPKYCYLNDNLKNFKVTPFIYYLPTTGESTLSVGYSTKEWSGNWQKIIGGKESLKVDFTGGARVNFKIPYVIENANGSQSVGFLVLDQSLKGVIFIQDTTINSLTLIPSIQEKITGFTDNEPLYQFFWSATTEKTGGAEAAETIAQLQQTIADLKSQIAALQAQLAALLSPETDTCQSFQNDLYYGMNNNLEVRCLQTFLKEQGQEIYPEAIISGNFLSLTKDAVIRFQEKYQAEILMPLGLEKGTGFFGSFSREKANQIIHK